MTTRAFRRAALLALVLLLASPWSGLAQEPAPPRLTPAEAEELLTVVRSWNGAPARDALTRLVAAGTSTALDGLARIASSPAELDECRRAVVAALTGSASDQASLYLVDVHRAVRSEFSQQESGLALARAWGAVARRLNDWGLAGGGPPPPVSEVGVLLDEAAGEDLDLAVLVALGRYPYAQVVEYLASVVREGSLAEGAAAARSLAGLAGGVGTGPTEVLLAGGEMAPVARLLAYQALLEGYGSRPGSPKVVLGRVGAEDEPALRAFLLGGLGLRGGPEALDVIPSGGALTDARLGGAIAWARDAVSARAPSDLARVLGFVGLVVVVGLAGLMALGLRLPPAVIERRYLERSLVQAVEVELAPTDTNNVVAGLLSLDPRLFTGFARISLTFGGSGELGFRSGSVCLPGEAPYEFVGGGTVVDGWHWTPGGTGKVAGNWFFDLRGWARAGRTVPVMLGFLHHGADEGPVAIELVAAGIRPDADPAAALRLDDGGGAPSA